MSAHEFDDGSFDPDELSILYRAFDEAWTELEPSVRPTPSAVNAARAHLAQAILSIALAGLALTVDAMREAALIAYWRIQTPSCGDCGRAGTLLTSISARQARIS